MDRNVLIRKARVAQVGSAKSDQPNASLTRLRPLDKLLRSELSILSATV
jgi:hypothetical protein